MAITKLRTNFQDDIINTEITDKRRYNLIQNADGTVSFEDVTTYDQVGSIYGAEEINTTNKTVNQLLDATSHVDNTSDSEKRVLYAEESGTSEYASESGHASTADNATNANTSEESLSSKKLTTARKINNVYFDGTKDITIEDDSKLPLNDYFVLTNEEELSFVNKVCTITDEKITEHSLADVYFTSDTILEAEKAVIGVESYNGFLQLTAGRTPEGTIKASITIRVVK